jgi:hypothetical protein
MRFPAAPHIAWRSCSVSGTTTLPLQLHKAGGFISLTNALIAGQSFSVISYRRGGVQHHSGAWRGWSGVGCKGPPDTTPTLLTLYVGELSAARRTRISLTQLSGSRMHAAAAASCRRGGHNHEKRSRASGAL